MLTPDDHPLRILHVEDDPSYARLVRDSLARTASVPHELVLASTVSDAVQRLETEPFDVALAALSLPDGEGLEVCRTLVPRTVRLSEAPSFGKPISVFDPMSRGAIAYRELAKEVSGGRTPQRTG